jgi:class 3 adenylate cyclase
MTGTRVGRTDLPTRDVTFLFTDIEGSTRLLVESGAGCEALQDAHAAILCRVRDHLRRPLIGGAGRS